MPDPDQEQTPAQPADPGPLRPLPRNVPTLTEVVGAETGADPSSAPAADDRPSTAGSSALPDAESVLALLGPDLDRQISEAIGRVLHEQMLGLNARVQKAVAEVVREAVVKAHTRGAREPDVGENP